MLEDVNSPNRPIIIFKREVRPFILVKSYNFKGISCEKSVELFRENYVRFITFQVKLENTPIYIEDTDCGKLDKMC